MTSLVIASALLAVVVVAWQLLLVHGTNTNGWVVFTLDARSNMDGTVISRGADAAVHDSYGGFLDMALSADGREVMVIGSLGSQDQADQPNYGITLYSIPDGAMRSATAMQKQRTPSTIFASYSLASSNGSLYVETGGGRLGVETLVKYDVQRRLVVDTMDMAGCGQANLLDDPVAAWPHVLCWGAAELRTGSRRVALPPSAVAAVSSHGGSEVYIFSDAGSIYRFATRTAGDSSFALMAETHLPHGWVVSHTLLPASDRLAGNVLVGVATNADASSGQFDEIWLIDPRAGALAAPPIRRKGTSFTLTPDASHVVIANSYTGRVTINNISSGAETTIESSADSPVLAFGVKR